LSGYYVDGNTGKVEFRNVEGSVPYRYQKQTGRQLKRLLSTIVSGRKNSGTPTLTGVPGRLDRTDERRANGCASATRDELHGDSVDKESHPRHRSGLFGGAKLKYAQTAGSIPFSDGCGAKALHVPDAPPTPLRSSGEASRRDLWRLCLSDVEPPIRQKYLIDNPEAKFILICCRV